MRGERFTDDRTEPGHQVEDARREADLVDDLGEDERVDGCDLRRLQNDGATGGERVGDLRADLVQRVVPRRDATDDADGLADDETVAGVLELERRRELRRGRERALMPMPTWIAADWPFGIPTSCVITSAISSRRASSSSATRRSSFERSGAGSSDHVANAALAAATARSMSSGTPAGIVAKTSSVVESITSSVSDPCRRHPRAVDVELLEVRHATRLPHRLVPPRVPTRTPLPNGRSRHATGRTSS